MNGRRFDDGRVTRFARARRTGTIVSVVALAGALVGWLIAPTSAFSAWLLAFMFWLGLSLGCLGLLMVQHLTGGRWGVVVRRPLESAAGQLPLVAVAFVPIAIGIPYLYAWAGPVETLDEVLLHKRAYLNVPFFLARAVGYFAIWALLAHLLIRWAREQDDAFTPERARRIRRLAAGGLIVYGVTMTLAGTDWVMSLDPHWFSTIFGILLIGGQGLIALAFVIVVSASLRTTPPLDTVLTPDRFHDLGKLLLAFVILWAYFSFSQYLIIWSENLPEEILWYVHRSTPAWQALAVGLMVFHFAVPFFVLLSRQVKRTVRTLVAVALFMMLMRVLDLFWLIVPSVPRVDANVYWLTALTLVAIGGIWMAAFLRRLAARPLLPLHDPELAQMTRGRSVAAHS